jgi:signal transduction histidine kinase
MALLPPSHRPAGEREGNPGAWSRAARLPANLLAWLSARSFSPPWLPARWRQPLIGYVAAALLAALAALLEFWLAIVFPAFSAHASLALFVVVLVALLFGSGPSLTAVLVSAMLLWFLALPPQMSWQLAKADDMISVALLAAAGLALSFLASRNEQARRAAVAAAQARDTFLFLAAHELRTPLTVVKANVELARRRARRVAALARQHDQAEVTAAVESLDVPLARAVRDGVREERLINELLDVGRLQQGTLTLHITPCDLASVVREAVADQRQRHPQRELRLDLPPGPALVMGDSERLGQVVNNYLSNALKYAPQNAPVDVTLSLSAGMARVAVRDRGPGLAPTERGRVWDLYHRTPGVQVISGSDVGLGLGLYLCRAIVQAHTGGQVGVDSVEGAGATFWFTLPLAEAADAE